jgi:(S)-mandelate dehydrogenase
MPWRRRPFRGRDCARALTIADLREIARRRVPALAFEYVEGGAEDEASLRTNREALGTLQLIPRTLVDTSGRHQRTGILGSPAASPLIIGPTGMNGILRHDGDLALARAAARAQIPFTLSTVSTTLLEEVAVQAPGRLWMQLYVMKDRKVGESLMERAAAAGYEALVFTTDANVFGSREWDRRNYRAPGKPRFGVALDTLRHPAWLWDVLLSRGMPRFRNFESFLPGGRATAVGGSTIIPQLFEPTITWKDLEWIRRHWPRKLIIKGILSVSDAEQAASLGVDGIVLTNHGGRQLDHCVAPIDMLPAIADRVAGKLAILVDGGFRRGTDVVKALALGAQAVLLGRATLYGLAAGGERGVDRALAILTGEIDRALGQLGVCSVAELRPDVIRRG